MIIEKFQEQVEANPGKIAVKAGNREITYSQLNTYANRAANAVLARDRDQDVDGSGANRQVSLLFEHGADMIIGVLAALKAGKTYVPLDVTYPSKRLIYMLENSGSYLILTNETNLETATQLAARAQVQIDILNIDTIVNQKTENTLAAPSLKVNPDSPAYILYTSGSTGQPKGVVQTQRNIMYYTRNWIRWFSITDSDRMTLFSAFSHDGSVQDMFAALLAGATLYPYNIKTSDGTNPLYTLLMKEKITIWHSVPTLFRYFCNTLTEKNVFYDIRWVLLGGEPLRPNDLELFRAHFPNATLANVYGQTESSVSTICTISQTDIFDAVCLGDPLDETEILLVGEDGDVIETMGLGEIVVACDYLAPGYWRDEETSKKMFTHDDELGRLYWTGDLGRLTMDSLIKVMGRKDSQIKIRGFRVETGEIESVLLQHEAVKEAVVMAKEDENIENYLCVYFVSHQTITPGEFREYLSQELPDYMIPRYFISLEQMPLTPNGKIDRRRLPEPEEVIVPGSEYVAPTNEIEKKLAAIWQEVLAVERVSIDDDFIELGGHSLLAISLMSKIREEFNVELGLGDVLNNLTVKEMSRVIMSAAKKDISTIEPVEEKEYYIASFDQKRLYVLNQLEWTGTAYNLTGVWQIEGKPDRQRLQRAFQKLIERHEAFRTSFRLMDDEVLQIIRKSVDFKMPYIEKENKNLNDKSTIAQIVKDFTRPFDLEKPPLIRVNLIKMAEDKHLLLLDVHHIISDGFSETILLKEIVYFYSGEQLPGLKLRFRDYSEWQNHLVLSGKLKAQEEYWLEQFKGEIPLLDLPYDFPESAVQSFEGKNVRFQLGQDMTRRVYQLARESGSTLFITLLAMYNVLLYKYTGQEDIIVGSLVAGRDRTDWQAIVGFLVKTLAMRNYPAAGLSFAAFLEQLKDNTLKAFENQMYPFIQLVEKLETIKDRRRNPLFDTTFSLLNIDMPEIQGNHGRDTGINAAFYPFEIHTTLFDLYFLAIEQENNIHCTFQYNTGLFNMETIELMKDRFLILIKNILNNPQVKLQDLDFAVPVEQEMRQVEEVEFDL